MANEVQLKLDTKATFTITLASLAAGNGRQSTMISNSNQRPGALVYVKIRTGGVAPNAGETVDVYLLRGNDAASSNYRSDGAGASDAAISILNAHILGQIVVTANTATDFYGEWDTAALGPLGSEWGIAVVNNTSQALDATEANFYKGYVSYVPEVQ
jgi:hypothetical protein